jgi:hypothetical protein
VADEHRQAPRHTGARRSGVASGSGRRPFGVLLVGLAVVAFAANCRQAAPEGSLTAFDDPPPFAHIHGLGVNPADGTLFAATHGGLYRISNKHASIVANRYQDTMGFTIAGKDHFIASGHPDLREELPPLLGLLESRDAGETWVKRSLLGKADFHALRVAHDEIWGYDSTSSTLMVSKDGERWDERSNVSIRDFVVSPVSPDVALATNGEALRRSEDGGRRWETSSAPDGPLLLGWEREDALWLVTTTGAVFRSTDSGKRWEEKGSLDGEPAAFVIADGSLYAATHDEIFVSTNDGKTWRPFYSEEQDQR